MNKTITSVMLRNIYLFKNTVAHYERTITLLASCMKGVVWLVRSLFPLQTPALWIGEVTFKQVFDLLCTTYVEEIVQNLHHISTYGKWLSIILLQSLSLILVLKMADLTDFIDGLQDSLPTPEPSHQHSSIISDVYYLLADEYLKSGDNQ